MFDGRIWPETYEYPPCDSCNGKTAKAELLTALLSKMHANIEAPGVERQFALLLAGVKNNFPEVFYSFQMSAAERKRLIRVRNIPLPESTLASEAALISLKHPEIHECMDLFAAKLLMALHYRHAGTAIPREGMLAYRWYTNAQVLGTPLPQDLLSVLRGSPQVSRQSTSLNEQFDYRFSVEAGETTSAYLVAFGTSFAILGMATADSAQHNLPERLRTLRPFPS